jgi:hypothetical protein
MKKVLTIVILIGLVCFSTSMARNPNTVKIPKAKSPEKAVLISLAGTVISYGILMSTSGNGNDMGITNVIVLGGTLIGPGLGHNYAGNEGRMWRGIGIRAAACGLTLLGAGLVLDATWNSNEGSEAPGIFFIFAGSIAFLGSSVYDIATADDSARKYNEENGLAAKAKISISPTYFVQHQAPGAAITLNF